jgi:hypothetical protein
LSVPIRTAECRNCGRERPSDELDRLRWCNSCRHVVIRRSSRWARLAALLATAALGAWIVLVVQPTRIVVVWMALLAATYLVVSRFGQRIAFEIIRARGVPPEESEDGKA